MPTDVGVNGAIEGEETPESNTFQGSCLHRDRRIIRNSTDGYEHEAKKKGRNNDESPFCRGKGTADGSTIEHASSFMAIVHISD